MFKEYSQYDAIGLSKLIQAQEVSPLQVCEAAIAQITKLNPIYNAVIDTYFDKALEQAKNGLKQGPLYGVPFLLKGLSTAYENTRTTFASNYLKDLKAHYNSEIVNRYIDSGLNILGKTNAPEMGLSGVTESALYGPARNPWDPTRTPGGSSGGAAVAVATGMVPVAHASDGGGSIRIPASCCGLFGLKPSRGRSPMGPDVGKGWQGALAEHALTRSVRDSALYLDIMNGPDLGAIFWVEKPENTFLSCLNTPVKKLKIAYTSKPFFPADGIDQDCQKALEHSVNLCESLGHECIEVFPSINGAEIQKAFLTIVAGETSGMVKLMSETLKRNPKMDELENATRLLTNAGKAYSAADFAYASGVFDRATRTMAHFMTEYDVIMTPTLAKPPVKIGEQMPNAFENALLTILKYIPLSPIVKSVTQMMSKKINQFLPFTPLFNVTGQPAMSVPLYWNQQGLPIGIQFAGRYLEESLLLQLAYQLETVAPWAHKYPFLAEIKAAKAITA